MAMDLQSQRGSVTGFSDLKPPANSGTAESDRVGVDILSDAA
jgi:hypothetical protein